MSRKQRTRKKQEAHEQTASDGQPAAQSGPGATARGNGANSSNGSNGTAANRRPEAKIAKDRQPAARQGNNGPLEEPLQKGDRVVIRMRSDWELEGELRAINDEVVRIFDFAVCDVLRLRRKDIVRIERLVDAD